MPTNRMIRGGARVVRDLVTRAHLRADLLPRLPFVVAIVVAAVAMVVAIEYDPETDAATVAVDELPSGPPTFYEGEYVEEEAELEILEYGFSKITDPNGRERLLVAVIARNPHDAELSPGQLAIRTETEEGGPDHLEDMFLGTIPPESTVQVGYVTYRNVDGIDVADLKVAAVEPSFIYPDVRWMSEDGDVYAPTPLPEVELAGIEPLTSPDGYRVHFRTESSVDAGGTRFSVLFRDGDGRLIGGLPVSADPLAAHGSVGELRLVPEGESAQHFDLHASWIPAVRPGS
jgi:hypothetical protein